MQSMPYYQQQQQQQQQGYPPQQQSVLNNAPMMGHPNGLPPMQHPGMSDQLGAPTQQPPKRKQVKNACTNCQKACKKCDDARPCPRCIKYGIADTCVNSVRKERKKGIKRGPYKRRQKTEEKTTTTTTTTTTSNRKAIEQNTPDQPPNQQYALRGPAIPFGYATSFSQHYDPYGQYTPYHKDQMMHQPYVMNYPPMGYPVMVPNGNNQQQQQQHYQHYNPMMQQQQQPSTSTPPRPSYEQNQTPVGSPQVYYHQQQNHSQPPSQRNSPHLPNSKLEQNTTAATLNQENFAKPQSMTPVPSTSTSTATSSSPDSGFWNPPRSS